MVVRDLSSAVPQWLHRRTWNGFKLRSLTRTSARSNSASAELRQRPAQGGALGRAARRETPIGVGEALFEGLEHEPGQGLVPRRQR